MIYLLILGHIALCYWLIFRRGTDYLDGSRWTHFLFRAGMDAREIRFWAAMSTLTIPVYWLLA